MHPSIFKNVFVIGMNLFLIALVQEIEHFMVLFSKLNPTYFWALTFLADRALTCYQSFLELSPLSAFIEISELTMSQENERERLILNIWWSPSLLMIPLPKDAIEFWFSATCWVSLLSRRDGRKQDDRLSSMFFLSAMFSPCLHWL